MEYEFSPLLYISENGSNRGLTNLEGISVYTLECKSKHFCGIIMPSRKDNILQFNQYMKSDKMPYITYADLEFSIKKSRWMYKQSRKIFNNKNR